MVNWYVMQSKPQKENFLFSQLNLHRIESYLPRITKKDHDGHLISRSFFPGYVFIHVDISSDESSDLQWIPGSKGVVSFGGQPASVPDQFILQLKEKLEVMNKKPKTTAPQRRRGDPVTIACGPFEGYQAIINEYLPDKDRVKIFLKSLTEGYICLEIPGSHISH